MSHSDRDELLSKVPQITLWFWVIKICATTVGETGGDALSMTLNLGYMVSSLIFLGFFVVTLIAQMASKRFHPLPYWLVVVATTTVGTTTSDYIDRTLKVGYPLASLCMALLVVVILIVWRLSTGTIAVDRITTKRNEIFYWVTILVSNTLGTALGDFTSDQLNNALTSYTHGVEYGFEAGALIFAGLIALVAILRFTTGLSRPVLFWAAYVLTRPLGATLGDTLTKPLKQGGLDLDRIAATAAIAAVMVVLVLFTERRRLFRKTSSA